MLKSGHFPIKQNSKQKKMNKISIFLFLFITVNAFGQHHHDEHSLNGVIYEIDSLNQKKPLAFTNVYWLHNNNGVISDEHGVFSLHKPHDKEPPYQIVVSFIGFSPDTLTITEETDNIEIVLEGSRNLEGVTITKRKTANIHSKINVLPTQITTDVGLQKLACCNIGESFESSATIDVGFTDAVSGAKKIRMLGLDGKYSQFLFENIPFMRGLESGYGLSHIPGPFMESIQVSKGTSSVLNGYESTTGQINVEYKKPLESDPFFVNVFANTEGRYETNLMSALQINEKWSTMFFVHGSMNVARLDQNNDGFYDKPLTRLINFVNRWEYDASELMHIQFGVDALSESRLGGQLDFSGRDENADGLYGIDIGINKFNAFGKLGFAFPNHPEQSLGWINSFNYFEQESLFGLREYSGSLHSYYSNLIWQTPLGNSNHMLSSGASFQYDNYSEFFIDSDYDRNEIVPGVFSQYTWTIPEKFVLMTGLRADFHSLHGFLFTPRVHMKYDLNEHYILRTSLGRSFRTANIFTENLSLLASSRSFILEDDFDMESAWNYGVSFIREFHLPGLREASLMIDFFRTEFQDQVVVDLDHSVSEVNIFNLQGKSYSNSFQVDFTGEVFRGFDMTLAYRLNDVKADYLDGRKEKPFIYRHKGLYTSTYTTPQGKWKIDLTVQYNGGTRIPGTEQNPQEFQLKENSPGFFMVHSQLTRKFNRLELYTGVENLTNFRQENAIINAENPFGDHFDATMVWGPLTGRMFYAGLRFNLKKIN